MIDTLWIGTTWRRRVTIHDDTTAPIDPDPIAATLCPETPLTVTKITAGVYDVSLDATTSADLCEGSTHWDMVGVIGADVVMLTRQDIRLLAVCAELPA